MVAFKNEEQQSADFSNFFHQQSASSKKAIPKIPGNNKKRNKIYIAVIATCLTATTIIILSAFGK
jgi:hypothetical protein